MSEISLNYENKNGWELADKEQKELIYEFCEGYKTFLSSCKTERESASYFLKTAINAGFISLDSIDNLQAGDKVYVQNRGKGLMLAVIGEEPLEAGLSIIGSHIDVPRIDIKQNPLYEDKELAFLKTHYYGGIKKYQWTTIPLAIHGVVVKQDGTKIDINIGEKDDDPVFTITDLLPHLAQKQMEGKLTEAITGEGLNVLIGSLPCDNKDEKEKYKRNILELINIQYGMIEEDFLSAELEIVPAHKARDVGFDRSLIGAYGHDDRVCAYTSFEAIMDITAPQKTCICLLVDKEEIGSMGNTGIQSRFFEFCIEHLCELTKSTKRKVISNSTCLSADVGAAVDPFYTDVQELKNAAFLNHGVLMTKYTGSRGKSGSSDANAEFVGKIRNILNQNGIKWQTGELGKVDMGGGGTIAQFIANMNIDVIDLGVPLLSMHSPFEIAAKYDVFMTCRAYKEYYKGM